MILLVRCKVCGDRPTRRVEPNGDRKGHLHSVVCQCGRIVTAKTEELAAALWNRANLPGEREHRQERCTQCGDVVSVSERAHLIQGKVYVCPQCDSKNRRTMYDGK